MFLRLTDPVPKPITLLFEDQPVEAREGDTVAAALWAEGIEWTGSRRVSGPGA